MRTHERGGQAKAYAMHTRGVSTTKYVRKNIPFCMYFCYIFICKVLLSYFVIICYFNTFCHMLGRSMKCDTSMKIGGGKRSDKLKRMEWKHKPKNVPLCYF